MVAGCEGEVEMPMRSSVAGGGDEDGGLYARDEAGMASNKLILLAFPCDFLRVEEFDPRRSKGSARDC
jgi:hypothetical protein